MLGSIRMRAKVLLPPPFGPAITVRTGINAVRATGAQ